MIASKLNHRSAALLAAGALALAVPAVSGAALLPGLGSSQSSSLTPVSSITGANTGVLGPDGPLGANGPLGGGGCLASNVNPNSLGMDGPLGPNGPLGPGGFAANLSCAFGGSSLFPSFSFPQFSILGG